MRLRVGTVSSHEARRADASIFDERAKSGVDGLLTRRGDLASRRCGSATATGTAGGGAAMGATSVAVPVYAAELAPPKLRGPLGGLFNVFISAGILAVFALGARGTDDGVWRWMAIAAVAPALAVSTATAVMEAHLVQSWMDPLSQARPLREVCKAHGVLFPRMKPLLSMSLV